MTARLPSHTELYQAEINRQWADAEWRELCAKVQRKVPTHAELTQLLNAVSSAVLSFHDESGFEHTASVCDAITEAHNALEYCFHRSAA